MKNNLLAVINGSGHNVIIRTSNPSFIPEYMVIELSTRKGYASYVRSALRATDIQLDNQTPTKVLLLPGTLTPQIKSEGEVEDQTSK